METATQPEMTSDLIGLMARHPHAGATTTEETIIFNAFRCLRQPLLSLALLHARQKAGYTQQRAADLLGITQDLYSRYENAVIEPRRHRAA